MTQSAGSTETAQPQAAERGRRHAANVSIPLLDWYRAQEAAALDSQARSASDIIRNALAEYLDRHVDEEKIRQLATEALIRDDEHDKRRAEVFALKRS